ncbi:unnamed protein product, partial [Sphacelaria rigidula]
DSVLAGSTAGVLTHGSYKAAAEKFGCHPDTISRLWKKYSVRCKAGVASPEQGNRRSKGNSGQK